MVQEASGLSPDVEAQLAIVVNLCVHNGECKKATLYYDRALSFVNEQTQKGVTGWKIFEMPLT